MSKKKKKKSRNSISRPRTVSPPETEKDEITGLYTADKKEAFRQWFKNAKINTYKVNDINKNIDPKQVIYGNKK